LTAWSRIACFETTQHADHAAALPTPESFVNWRNEATQMLQDQPAIKQLVETYDQLHRMARLTILKAPEGSAVSRGDYVAVTLKFQEFIEGLRRVERAIAAAESGLDNLTGLRSRAGMQNDLTREMSRFKRNGKPFCVALMDIDYFKKINDSYGHDCGDKVLVAVANFVSRCLRPVDDVWRWGGEEFLLCIKEADLVNGAIALERVRGGLEKLPVHLGDGRTIKITASFGITTSTKETTIDDLLKQADQALYRAKEEGRNRVEAMAADL
jgi:diguanylate cyclase (GGDEF)-like protein